MMDLVELLLQQTDWSRVAAAPYCAASEVPERLRRLLAARTAGEAREAYWLLDNFVVVQGQLYGAALPLIAPLMVGLQGNLSSAATASALNLVAEIALGEASALECDAGHEDLGKRCRAEARRGLWTLYAHLCHPNPDARGAALDAIGAVDLDHSRVRAAAAHMAASDPEERLRRYASDPTYFIQSRD